MATVSESMVIDRVDRRDQPVGTIRRSEVFARGTNFRVIHIFVFNHKTELLIQQLASDRSRHPGYWGSSVAGYMFTGESYEVAARRRLTEELGIKEARLNFVGKTSMEDEGCTKFIGLFSAVHEGPFDFDHTHIQRLEFLPLRIIDELRGTHVRRFTPTFLKVLSFYESKL